MRPDYNSGCATFLPPQQTPPTTVVGRSRRGAGRPTVSRPSAMPAALSVERRERALEIISKNFKRLNHHRRGGTGPTIVTAVTVSSAEPDVAFVKAAARGDVSTLRQLLPRVSSVDVRCRVSIGGRPSTALHLAAAAGSIEAADLLLEAGADPSARMEWLRALTPLHVAGTVPMARRLLAAGASPVALDPREPDPAWYQRTHGRRDVADTIAAARPVPQPRPASASHHRQRSSRGSASDAGGSSALAPAESPAPRQVMPSLTAADIALVREAWSLSLEAAMNAGFVGPPGGGAAACWSAATGKPTTRGPGLQSGRGRAPAASNGAPSECAICMGDFAPADDAPDAPSGHDSRDSAATNRRTPSATGGRKSLILLPCGHGAATPHLFHADCLARWLLQKATCPACRRDVRPLLRHAHAPAPACAPAPALPSPERPPPPPPQSPVQRVRVYQSPRVTAAHANVHKILAPRPLAPSVPTMGPAAARAAAAGSPRVCPAPRHVHTRGFKELLAPAESARRAPYSATTYLGTAPYPGLELSPRSARRPPSAVPAEPSLPSRSSSSARRSRVASAPESARHFDVPYRVPSLEKAAA